MLVPGQHCPTCLPACLGGFTGWLNQSNVEWYTLPVNGDDPVPHLLSCVLLLLLCWCWHHPEHSLEAGGNYRLSFLNWVTVGTTGVSVPATGIAWEECMPEEWGSLSLWWMLAQSSNTHHKACAPCALRQCHTGVAGWDCVEELLWTGKQNLTVCQP